MITTTTKIYTFNENLTYFIMQEERNFFHVSRELSSVGRDIAFYM